MHIILAEKAIQSVLEFSLLKCFAAKFKEKGMMHA